MLRLAIYLSGDLTIGDLLVGGGTLALAFFTWQLAKETVDLDTRNAARERKRREREVRGVARLVDGELEVVARGLRFALERERWSVGLQIPRGAWDRDGALITETVAEDEALALIRLFSDLNTFAATVRASREDSPDARMIRAEVGSDVGERLALLLAQVEEVRSNLRRHSYPDARDLEPDPDVPRPKRSPLRRLLRRS